MKKQYSPPLCETVRVSCGKQMLTASNEGFVINDTPLFPSTSSSLFNETNGLMYDPCSSLNN